MVLPIRLGPLLLLALVGVSRSEWREYGKGRHAAGVNFGDCFAYALAKWSGEKLLAKGEDFRFTKVELA